MTTSPQGPPGRVLIIGLDGCRPDALRLAPTPNITALIQAGAVSGTAHAGGALSAAYPTHQATSSGPGWASILTGVWVDRHGVANQSFSNNNLATYPHFFAHVRSARPTANLASIVHWDPINDQLLLPFPGLATFTQELASDTATAAAAAKRIDDGAWHQLAVTHDRDGLVSFYQDGEFLTSGELASPGGIDGLNTALGQDGTLTYPLGNTAEFDELRIWRRTLGQSEAARLWGSGPSSRWRPLVGGSIGSDGIPTLAGTGALTSGTAATIALDHAAPNTLAVMAVGFVPDNSPFFGALLSPAPLLAAPMLPDAQGHATLPLTMPANMPSGLQMWFQAWTHDTNGPFGLAASQPLLATVP